MSAVGIRLLRYCLLKLASRGKSLIEAGGVPNCVLGRLERLMNNGQPGASIYDPCPGPRAAMVLGVIVGVRST